MAIWVAEQYGHQRKCRPCLDYRAFPDPQGDDARERPDRLQHRDECTLSDRLTEVRDADERAYSEDRTWNRQEICSELCPC